jgi:hypothetical protein
MTLPLKNVHAGVAPSWWPPAPGWWLVTAGVLALVVLGSWLWRRRGRRHAALLRVFDDAVAGAGSPVQQVAAMSELLRRAGRRIKPEADRLDGEAWLRFLDDGLEHPAFVHGPGALLGDGGFRPDVDPAAVEALHVVARQRYLDWMRRA